MKSPFKYRFRTKPATYSGGKFTAFQVSTRMTESISFSPLYFSQRRYDTPISSRRLPSGALPLPGGRMSLLEITSCYCGKFTNKSWLNFKEVFLIFLQNLKILSPETYFFFLQQESHFNCYVSISSQVLDKKIYCCIFYYRKVHFNKWKTSKSQILLHGSKKWAYQKIKLSN